MFKNSEMIQPVAIGDLLRTDDRLRVNIEGQPYWLDAPPAFVGMVVVKSGAVFRRGGMTP